MGNSQVRPTTNLTDAVRSSVMVKMLGFRALSVAMGSGGDGCLCLPMPIRCSVGGHEWEIRCYPASSVCNMWVSLKLALLAQPSAAAADDVVNASLACRLIHPAGTGTAVVEPPAERTVSATFARRQGGESASLVLAHRRDLEVLGYLGDDGSLTMEFVVTVLGEPTDANRTSSEKGPGAAAPMPTSNLHRHFGELLRSGTGADVTFVVSGEVFAAHTVVLAARSPAFMAKFYGEEKKKKKCPRRVEVEGMEAEDFKAMLHFIYTDTAPPDLDRQDEYATLMALRLLMAADRYGLDRLKVICSRRLSSDVTVETAAAILVLAERHKCPRLKATCVEFIVGTPAILEAVLATDGYKQLETSCPSLLADLLKSARGRKN